MADSTLHILVKPRAPRNEVRRTADGLLVRVTAPPVEGAANTAIIALLAATLDLPKSRITISAGASGRHKRVTISGLAQPDLDGRLAAIPEEK